MINGNRNAANVTEIGCGMGVEVTARDDDGDRERDEGVIHATIGVSSERHRMASGGHGLVLPIHPLPQDALAQV